MSDDNELNKKPLILFIGGIWLKEQEKEMIMKSKGAVQSAANVLQTNIIMGIDENTECPITVLSAKFVGAFPRRYKDAFIRGGFFNHSLSKDHLDYEIAFLNLPIIKHYSRTYHIQKIIKKIFEHEERPIYVIGYSMTYSIVKALSYAKRIKTNVKTCLIVPDLPEYMNLGKSRGMLFSVLKKHSTRKVYETIKTIDSFVLLTKEMYEKLHVTAPFVVMEGIAPDDYNTVVTEAQNKDDIRNIVYTGALGVRYGIVELVNAFTSIKNDTIRLIICGAGDGADYIIKQAQLDNRIVFLGTVSNDRARELQKTAYLLVNPRNSKEDYTEYSFPSKTLEYMMSGNPVLMFKLKGVPDSYDKYLFYIENNLKESLEYVLSLPEEIVKNRGREGKEFVRQYKNKTFQTAKIIDMMNNL